jgi:chromosome segregation ATPase
MALEKEDIDALGEALEAIGNLFENEFAKLNQRLTLLEKYLSTKEPDGKVYKQEFYELKKDTQEIREFLESFDVRMARIEQKVIDIQREAQEGGISEIKNDLFLIQKELEFIRNDTKEILESKEFLDKKMKELDERLRRLEGEKFV